MNCISCHKPIFYCPEASEEMKKKDGCVYSEAGLREVNISGMCEACFDKYTADEDEDEERIDEQNN